MVDTNKDYSLPEDMQEAREDDVKLYLDYRKQMPDSSKDIAKVILDGEGYKARKPLILEKKKEKRVDQVRYDEIQEQRTKLSPKSIESLPNTAQAQKRTDMVNYAEENDSGNFEKIKGWHAKINELRAQGVISDNAEGVTIRGIGTLASTATHERILKEKFDRKIEKPMDLTDHSGNKSEISTVRKNDLVSFLSENDGELVSGNFRMPGQDFVTGTIFSWIENTFGGNLDQSDKLYILQMINPDLFTRFWFNSNKGSGQQTMGLGNNVVERHISTLTSNFWCGVLLVGNA